MKKEHATHRLTPNESLQDLLLSIHEKVLPMKISFTLRGIDEKVQTILHMSAPVVVTGGGLLVRLLFL